MPRPTPIPPQPDCATARARGHRCLTTDGPDALGPGQDLPSGVHRLPACVGCRRRPNALLHDLGRRHPPALADCLTPDPVDAAGKLRAHYRAYYGTGLYLGHLR